MKFYDQYIEATFLDRPNRFVMELEHKGKTLRAYVPNTGRMEEFLYEGATFFLARHPSYKFDYKVVATRYQGHLVFLDTVKVNRVFYELLKAGKISEFPNIKTIRREVGYKNSRIDFLLTFEDETQAFVEVKSCTLIHNGVAMFPDAPTERGKKHIDELNENEFPKIKKVVYFLITNYSAEKFLPNYHVDFEYAKSFLAAEKVIFYAGKINLPDPVSLDLDSFTSVPIDYHTTKQNTLNKGSYLLLMENQKEHQVDVGKLGQLNLKPGFYIYIGSGMVNLEKRARHHQHTKKSRHYHIDYITPGVMKIKKAFLVRSHEKRESEIALQIEKVCDEFVDGFGCSDTGERSHLFYFAENPLRNQRFYQQLLDFRVC
ncbi:MAG: DNA/RNA nuclease SfsA [Candidatus Marinimicrobia bacterium]|nr:DNA/RNA nuclease SfsA [Candidatus Neomarinimicrobiota bacterium]